MKWIYYILSCTILISCRGNKKDFPVNFEINQEYIDTINKLIVSEFSNGNVFTIGSTRSPNTLICKIKNDTIVENAVIFNSRTDSIFQLKKEHLKSINEKFNYNKLKLNVNDYANNTHFMSGYADYILLYFKNSELESSLGFHGWQIDWSNEDLAQLSKIIILLYKESEEK